MLGATLLEKKVSRAARCQSFHHQGEIRALIEAQTVHPHLNHPCFCRRLMLLAIHGIRML
jgi:hypothetical protein